MSAEPTSETRRVRYLLGMSSPAERQQIESEYFEDDVAFAEMLTAEDDLIDAYARGELAGVELQRFENIFVSSLLQRDRVQFARAFGRALSSLRSVETKLCITFDIFKTFRSPRFLRTATIAAVIVLLAMLAWLVIDRRRMANGFRELHAESIELRKQTEALQRSSDIKRVRAVEVETQLADLRDQANKLRHRESRTTTQRARHLLEVKNDREKNASSKPEQAKNLINTQDASLVIITDLPISSRKWSKPSTMEAATARQGNVAGTTLRGTIRDSNGNVVSGATVTLTHRTRNFTRTQSTNKDGAYVFNAIPSGTYSVEVKAPGFKTVLVSGLPTATLLDTPTVWDMQLEVGAVSERVDVTAAAEAAINTSDASLGNSFARKRITELPLNANNVEGLLSLQPGITRKGSVNGGPTDQSNITLEAVDDTILIPNSRSWIRFRIALKSAAIHEDYLVTIKTGDGHPITSVNWIEPLTTNQTIIDTPVISTGDLPSGDYVLLLMGKARNGSFVKVAEYSFKIIKH